MSFVGDGGPIAVAVASLAIFASCLQYSGSYPSMAISSAAVAPIYGDLKERGSKHPTSGIGRLCNATFTNYCCLASQRLHNRDRNDYSRCNLVDSWSLSKFGVYFIVAVTLNFDPASSRPNCVDWRVIRQSHYPLSTAEIIGKLHCLVWHCFIIVWIRASF